MIRPDATQNQTRSEHSFIKDRRYSTSQFLSCSLQKHVKLLLHYSEHHRDCLLEVFLCDLPSNAWDTVATTVTPSAISSAAQQDPHEETVNGMANVQMDNFYHLSS